MKLWIQKHSETGFISSWDAKHLQSVVGVVLKLIMQMNLGSYETCFIFSNFVFSI